MTAFQRWCIVAVGGLLLVAAVWVWPIGPGGGATNASEALPVGEVLASIEAAKDAPYSGYVETTGTLRLPVASSFTDVGNLLGERTLMRAWWRTPNDWRVNKLLAAGETDLIHHGDQTIEWSYEKSEATAYFDPDIRLPRTSDLLPPALGARAVVDADPDSLERIDDAIVAGRQAFGLRVQPTARGASIDHVDIWADADSGIPLRLEVYAAGSTEPDFTSEFREFSDVPPPPSATAFTPPSGSKLSSDDVLDVADAANQYAEATPPKRLGGLARTEQTRGAVGVYGAGMTQLVAIPLWDRAAVPLRKQLRITPEVKDIPEGQALTLGPLSVLLTEYPDGYGWLLAGTVTPETLRQAARQIQPGGL